MTLKEAVLAEMAGYKIQANNIKDEESIDYRTEIKNAIKNKSISFEDFLKTDKEKKNWMYVINYGMDGNKDAEALAMKVIGLDKNETTSDRADFQKRKTYLNKFIQKYGSAYKEAVYKILFDELDRNDFIFVRKTDRGGMIAEHKKIETSPALRKATEGIGDLYFKFSKNGNGKWKLVSLHSNEWSTGAQYYGDNKSWKSGNVKKHNSLEGANPNRQITQRRFNNSFNEKDTGYNPFANL